LRLRLTRRFLTFLTLLPFPDGLALRLIFQLAPAVNAVFAGIIEQLPDISPTLPTRSTHCLTLAVIDSFSFVRKDLRRREQGTENTLPFQQDSSATNSAPYQIQQAIACRLARRLFHNAPELYLRHV
jgi:hypothetical protein